MQRVTTWKEMGNHLSVLLCLTRSRAQTRVDIPRHAIVDFGLIIVTWLRIMGASAKVA